MKILLIANSESIYVKELIEFVYSKMNCEIYLTSYGPPPVEYLEYYKNNVHLIDIPLYAGIFGKIPFLRHVVYRQKLVKALGKQPSFDVVWIHYVTKWRCRYAKALLNEDTKLFCSFWGSDILRASTRKLKSLEKYLKIADAITLSGKQMHDSFKQIFGNKYISKIYETAFGTNSYNRIDDILKEMTIQDCKEEVGIKREGNIVVSVGYNRAKQQQHDKVLLSIKRLPKEQQEKLTIILMMTYGPCDQGYMDSIKQLVSELHSEVIFFNQYLSDRDVAIQRLATDIFINAQITDAFSASMREYFYVGARVINPVWIKYAELDQLGVEYWKFSTFDNLTVVLEEIIADYNNSRLDVNRASIKDRTSWSAAFKGWKKVVASTLS